MVSIPSVLVFQSLTAWASGAVTKLHRKSDPLILVNTSSINIFDLRCRRLKASALVTRWRIHRGTIERLDPRLALSWHAARSQRTTWIIGLGAIRSGRMRRVRISVLKLRLYQTLHMLNRHCAPFQGQPTTSAIDSHLPLLSQCRQLQNPTCSREWAEF